jgi:hypothetical protein
VRKPHCPAYISPEGKTEKYKILKIIQIILQTGIASEMHSSRKNSLDARRETSNLKITVRSKNQRRAVFPSGKG